MLVSKFTTYAYNLFSHTKQNLPPQTMTVCYTIYTITQTMHQISPPTCFLFVCPYLSRTDVVYHRIVPDSAAVDRAISDSLTYRSAESTKKALDYAPTVDLHQVSPFKFLAKNIAPIKSILYNSLKWNQPSTLRCLLLDSVACLWRSNSRLRDSSSLVL